MVVVFHRFSLNPSHSILALQCETLKTTTPALVASSYPPYTKIFGAKVDFDGRKEMNRIQTFRRSKAYLYIAGGYAATTSTMSFTMFHPILPFYLRDILATNCTTSNVTDDVIIDSNDVIFCRNETWLEEEISRQIGVISGSGSIMMLISNLLSAFLIQRVSLRLNHYISVMMSLMCPLLAFFARDVTIMCFSVGFACGGQPYTFTCYASLYSELAENDKELTRFHGIFRIFIILGFIAGYSAASVSYQFFGHKITFGIAFCLVATDSVFRSGLIMRKGKTILIIEEPKDTGDEILEGNEEMDELHEIQDMDELQERQNMDELQERQDSDAVIDETKSWKTQLKLLTNPFIILNSISISSVYLGTSIFWGTSANFVATELGAEQWQTGTMMGIGTTIDMILQLIATVTINTQKRRISMMILGNLLLACGYFWYPFVGTVWLALPPESLVRSFKDLLTLMITTMYPYILDCIGVEEKRLVYAMQTAYASLGVIIGYYISGVLVVSIGFRNLYMLLGTMSLITSFLSFAFLRLKPKQPNVMIDPKISISLADLNRTDLGLTDLTASRVTLRKSRSNFSLHNVKKTDSKLQDLKSNYLTPQIPRRLHLMPPDSLRVVHSSTPHLHL